MINKDDELKYKDVIDSLKGLQKVNAPANFETDLTRRINAIGSEEKGDFWKRFFVPSKLIPSAALAVSAVVLLFVFDTNNDNENPLLMNPRVRTDVISTDDISEVHLSPGQNSSKHQSEKSLGSNSDKFRDEKTYKDSNKRNPGLSFSGVEYSIDKNGLNFRQVNLSQEERESLIRVKSRFIKLIKNGKKN
jgi:hypothetical protein